MLLQHCTQKRIRWLCSTQLQSRCSLSGGSTSHSSKRKWTRERERGERGKSKTKWKNAEGKKRRRRRERTSHTHGGYAPSLRSRYACKVRHKLHTRPHALVGAARHCVLVFPLGCVETSVKSLSHIRSPPSLSRALLRIAKQPCTTPLVCALWRGLLQYWTMVGTGWFEWDHGFSCRKETLLARIAYRRRQPTQQQQQHTDNGKAKKREKAATIVKTGSIKARCWNSIFFRSNVPAALLC